MRKILLTSLSLIAFTSVVSAANKQPVPREPGEMPSQINATITRAQTFELRLPACLSCGSLWRIVDKPTEFAQTTTEKLPKSIVEVVTEDGLPTATGVNQVQVFHFPKLDPGNHEFQIQYGRPTEPASAKPTVLLKVLVTSDPQ